MKNVGVRHIVAALSTLVVLPLAACSSSSNTQEGFTDIAGVQQEYKDTVASLTFPKSFPPPAELEGEIASSFQKGWGNVRASLIWQCSWEKEWLDNYAKDKVAASNAIAELDKAPSMRFMNTEVSDDATRRIFKENLEKAKLNDPSGMQNDVSINCK